MTQSKTHASPEAMARVIETVRRLRAPGGCPWDRAQTHQSLRQYLIEEAYEVLDVLDEIASPESLKNERTRLSFQEELGDLLMQVLLHSEMTSEVEAFNIYDVAHALDDKLVRRHPHVFGDKSADSVESAFQTWEKQKAKEKAARKDSSILEGVPRNLPALQKAARVIEKVTKVGFQWNDLQGPLDKVQEELAELKVEISAIEKDPGNADAIRKRIEAEMGDLLFSLCNLSFALKVSPEDSLRSTLARFEGRFRHVEKRLKEIGKTPEQSDLAEMDIFWNDAKKLEKVAVWGLTGGIGTGKSTAGKFFEESGIPVIDADQISRELSQEGGLAYPAIVKRFGTGNRAQLREIIFSDPEAKRDLEAILHPLIQINSREKMLELAKKHSVLIYEGTLLVETGRHRELSGLIVVDAPHEARVQRVMKRDSTSRELAEKIVKAQSSIEGLRPHATFVLENDSTVDELHRNILSFISEKGWRKNP